MAGRDKVSDELPRLYTEFADWFHLLTAPADYAEEAAFFLRLFTQASGAPDRMQVARVAGRDANMVRLGQAAADSPNSLVDERREVTRVACLQFRSTPVSPGDSATA